MVQLRKAAVLSVWLALSPLLLSGCELEGYLPKEGQLSDIQDRQQELTKQDYRDLNKTEELVGDDVEVDADLGAPPVPDLAQVLAAPQAPKVGNTKIVTLSVTEDVPLRDVLFELGRLADVDIEVGSGLDVQGINLRATNRPFNEVIDRIATLGNLRYSVEGNSIRVERDLPFIQNYNLDFVNLVRSSTSSYTLSTSVLSGSGGSGGESSSSSGGGEGESGGSAGGNVGTSGSSSAISASSESDLWSSLEASIAEILAYSPRGQEEAVPSAGGTVAASGAARAGGTANFVINRQAGVLSVNATERQHGLIQRFLDLMQRNASAQVLIEAKIVEVSLEDQFASGVDWNSIIGDSSNAIRLGDWQPGAVTDLSFAAGSAGGNGAISFVFDHADLDLLVQLTERFGTTRTLSSPRLSAINNQQAVLTFARNVVFFDCTVEPAQSTVTDTSTTSTPGTADCTASAVPIGIILNVLPSINLDTQEITLSVRPTLTRAVGQEENPEGRILASIVAQSGGDESTVPRTFVPIVEVREIDSVMKVRSGGVMVIGGLMEDVSTTEARGVPGASDIPLLGNLFKSRDELYTKRELIIFIKATIVDPNGSVGRVDRGVVKKYTTDPRPLFR